MSCLGRSFSRLQTAIPMRVMPRRSIMGIGSRQQPSRHVEDRLRLGGRALQRAGAGRSREVVEAKPEDDRPAHAPGGAHPAGDAVHQAEQGGVELVGGLARAAEGTLRSDRPAPAPWLDATRIPVQREGVDVPSRGHSEHGHERAFRERGYLADRCDSDLMQPAGGDRADAPEPLDGRAWRNASSRSGCTTSRPSGLATPLATFARNFVLATPTVIGKPTRSRTSRRETNGDRRGTAREPSHPAHVEERLVDRHAFDQGRGVLEDPVDRLARLDVGGHARRDDHRVRAQPASRRSAHGRTDAVRLRFVARREHDSRADDHRPAAQARVVSLLDRRVERVDVGVENRRLG